MLNYLIDPFIQCMPRKIEQFQYDNGVATFWYLYQYAMCAFFLQYVIQKCTYYVTRKLLSVIEGGSPTLLPRYDTHLESRSSCASFQNSQGPGLWSS